MDLIHRFLLHSPFTKQTQATYRHILVKLSEWLEENEIEFQTISIDKYFSYLEMHDWSQNTQRLHINAARSYAKWRYGDSHPLMSFNLPRHDTKPGRSLSEDKLETLLASFDTTTGKGCRDLAVCSLLAETGIRANEAATLKLDHLDMDNLRMKVLAKGRRWQDKIFSRDTAQVLGMWLAWRPNYADRYADTVFVSVGGNTPGKPLTKYGIQSIFRYKSRDIGFKISPHDLRRTFATLFIQHGAPTRVVQELGGWSDLSEVERYTRNLEIKDVEQYSPIVRKINIHKDSLN